MCDVIEIGIDGLLIWSISQKDGRDVCLCANNDEEIYAYCLKWVEDNVTTPEIEDRVVIEHTVWGWAIYKEKCYKNPDGEYVWEAVHFADEDQEDPQTKTGKKLKKMLAKMIAEV